MGPGGIHRGGSHRTRSRLPRDSTREQSPCGPGRLRCSYQCQIPMCATRHDPRGKVPGRDPRASQETRPLFPQIESGAARSRCGTMRKRGGCGRGGTAAGGTRAAHRWKRTLGRLLRRRSGLHSSGSSGPVEDSGSRRDFGRELSPWSPRAEGPRWSSWR